MCLDELFVKGIIKYRIIYAVGMQFPCSLWNCSVEGVTPAAIREKTKLIKIYSKKKSRHLHVKQMCKHKSRQIKTDLLIYFAIT